MHLEVVCVPGHEHVSWDPERIKLFVAVIGLFRGSKEHRMEHHITGMSWNPEVLSLFPLQWPA